MDKLNESICITKLRLREWKSNNYIFLGSILFFILCIVIGNKYVSYANSIGLSIQVFEPFIAVLTNRFSLILLSLIFMLMFNDFPSDNKALSYYLVRTTRKRWLIGQIIYVFVLLFILIFGAIVIISLIHLKNSYIRNVWSDAAYFSANSRIGFNINILLINNSTPYKSILNVCGLTMLYGMFVSFLLILFNFLNKRILGLIILGVINLSSYIYSFQFFEITRLMNNLIDINYLNYLNSYSKISLTNVYSFFVIVVLILGILCVKVSKRYQFNFKFINKGEY